jgi:MFS family permease
VTSFFTDIGSEMIFPLLPVFVADTLGGGAAFLGIIEGAADAIASLLKLFSGRMADRLPRKKPLILTGYGLATLVRPLMAVAGAPWHALVVRLLDRTGKGIRSSPRDALIADAAEPGAVGRAFGFHRAMDHAGAVVGPLLATLLMALHVPIRSTFWIAAIPGLFALVALALVREAPRATVTPTKPRSLAKGTLPSSLKIYLGILLLFSIGNSSDAFLLLRARELGIPLALIPALWAVLHVSKVLWSYVGGVWSDGVPRVRLIITGWLVFAATYFALGFADRPWHVWALFIVYGAFYGLSEPAEKALVKDLAPEEARGAAFGSYNFIVGVAALPASILTGWLWSSWSPRVALTMGASVAMVAALLLLIWETRRHAVGR